MRKLLVAIIVLVLVFSSCDVNRKEDFKMIEYQTGSFYNKNWSEQIGTYNEDVIPDKDTAVAVANQIFNGMKKSAETEKFTVQSVFYDEVDRVWIVTFWEDRGQEFDGYDCSIAIQREDGKVLRIWFGE